MWIRNDRLKGLVLNTPGPRTESEFLATREESLKHMNSAQPGSERHTEARAIFDSVAADLEHVRASRRPYEPKAVLFAVVVGLVVGVVAGLILSWLL